MNDQFWAARSLSKFKPIKVSWLFKPFIPYGTITTITGDGEVGKSTMIYDFIARITTGYTMPRIGGDAKQHTDEGSVLIFTKEDDPGVIRLRLEAAEADIKKVHFVELRKTSRHKSDDVELMGRLDNTIQALTELIIELGDVRLILIDPITDFAGDLNLYREDQVRRLLGPISRLAQRFNIAVINVVHLVKDTKKAPRQRILGSVGLVNVSRSVLMIGKIGSRRFLMMEKYNWYHERKNAAFTMKTFEGQPVIEWETEYADVDINEVLTGKSIYTTKQQKAVFALRKLLMDGPMQSTEIELKADELDISWNTFKAAKKELGIKSERIDNVWWWQLPKDTREQD